MEGSDVQEHHLITDVYGKGELQIFQQVAAVSGRPNVYSLLRGADQACVLTTSHLVMRRIVSSAAADTRVAPHCIEEIVVTCLAVKDAGGDAEHKGLVMGADSILWSEKYQPNVLPNQLEPRKSTAPHRLSYLSLVLSICRPRRRSQMARRSRQISTATALRR